MRTREARTTTRLAAFGLAAMLTGCPQPTEETPDAFRAVDAFEVDAVVQSDAPEAMDAFAESDVTVPPDAVVPPDAPRRDGGIGCSAEGMFRRVPCACGGMQSEQCTSGRWTLVTPCDRMTVCTAGAFETRDGTRCSVEQRECPDGCAWTAWTTVVPRGACAAGAPDRCISPVNCRCTATCQCEPVPGCPFPVRGD